MTSKGSVIFCSSFGEKRLNESASIIAGLIDYEQAFNKAGKEVNEMGEGHLVTEGIVKQARGIYNRVLRRYVAVFPALCVFEEQIKHHLIQGLFCGIKDEELLAAAAVVRAHGDFLYREWVGELSSRATRMLRMVRQLSYRMTSHVAVHLAQASLDRPIEGPLDPPLLVVRQCRSQLESVLKELGRS